ncbi:hypothetical protein AB0B78_02305 [Streptomyces sp. NPDC040724]|uniref:hypothetical protein n=1 Tax=unclassified Streptomyces TaxID=2593676 RepID=UPI0033F20C3B
MPFEDDLGVALRRAGEGFTADRDALADAGEQRGRRLVARRRHAAAAGGSVLALALIATAGAYAGGLLDGAGRAGTVNVAAPPTTPGGDDKGPLAGSGAVTAAQMIANLRELLPGGQLTEPDGRGSEDQVPMASGVYDDGKGKAAVSLALSRVDPAGSNARAMTECGDKNVQEYDDCRTEQLADGSRLLLYKGYEYPDRRVDTKLWRAVLATPKGFMVELSEWNSPAEKGAPVSRSNPPLTPDQLKTVVTSPLWQPALNDLPAPAPDPAPSARPGSSAALRDREAAVALEELVTGIGIKIPILSWGGEGGHGYIVFDDGKGKSLVSLSVGRSEGVSGFPGLNQPPLPDGTLVNVKQGPAEKGKGVIEWQVDTLRTDGLRVVVSAYNTANQSGTATREQPALTLDQLKEIALAPGWNRTRN